MAEKYGISPQTEAEPSPALVNPPPADDLDKTDLTANSKAGFAVIDQAHTIPEGGTRKTTTSLEYWSYCLYNWGGTGVGVGNYGGALQQSTVEQAFPSGFLEWGGQRTSTTSFILYMNGIIFAVQIFLLICLGPYSDYGNWRPWILIAWTVVGIVVSFVFLAADTPQAWQLSAAMYVLGNLALNMVNTFWTAPFPTLVRDLPELQASERQVIEGTKSPEEHAQLDMMERSKMSNWAFMFEYVGSFLAIVLVYGIAFGIGHTTDAQNNKVFAVVAAYFGAIWIISSVPWFIFDQRRPGQKLPDNTSWLTVGFKQIWEAARNVVKLRQTFLYIAAYFLITDSNTTSGNIIQILQNNAISFDTVTYTGLYAIVYGASGAGLALQMWIQRTWKISPRTMFLANAFFALLYTLWGCIGNYTKVIGYHNVWEFYLFQAYNGFFTGGAFSYANTVMAEVSPAPKMYIFFCLFNTVGKTSTFIGPFISGAIVDAANGDTNEAFWFTFGTGLIGLILLWCVNVPKAKEDNARYLLREREDLYASYGATHIVEEVLENNAAPQNLGLSTAEHNPTRKNKTEYESSIRGTCHENNARADTFPGCFEQDAKEVCIRSRMIGDNVSIASFSGSTKCCWAPVNIANSATCVAAFGTEQGSPYTQVNYEGDDPDIVCAPMTEDAFNNDFTPQCEALGTGAGSEDCPYFHPGKRAAKRASKRQGPTVTYCCYKPINDHTNQMDGQATTDICLQIGGDLTSFSGKCNIPLSDQNKFADACNVEYNEGARTY
ncbi:hypothetical protein PRZ48_012442 [Zasmidium cellare]|uniref:Autophagy-related protein n=1 Tax=Zasmidium cellare TaxID=395010 RepID=A0ABR0E4X5_ZASCE|nr:hypothetical protein PRZ48_012442 [Zasmidium cellare]